jgi:hypothetical protein
MLAYHKADEFWKRRFTVQLVDEKWWSTVHVDQHAPVAGVHQNDIDLSTEGVGTDMVCLHELFQLGLREVRGEQRAGPIAAVQRTSWYAEPAIPMISHNTT